MLFLPKRSFSFWNTKMTWVQKYLVWWKKKKVLKTGVFHPENCGFLKCCSFPARWFYSWTQLSSFAWFYVTLCYMFNFIDTEPFQLLRPIGIKVVSHYNKWITQMLGLSPSLNFDGFNSSLRSHDTNTPLCFQRWPHVDERVESKVWPNAVRSPSCILGPY